MAGILFLADAVGGAPNYTGQMARAGLSALMGGRKAARPLGARSGVTVGTAVGIINVTSTTWTVHAHAGVIDLQTAATAGASAYAFLTDETGSMTAASGSNQRVDSLFVQHNDPSQGDGTAAPAVVIVYAAGTAGAAGGARGAAGGPPNFPNSRCFELAQITVPISGGGSPVAALVAPQAVAAGGLIPVAGYAAADAPANPYRGQYIDDPTYGLMRYNGALWIPQLLRVRTVVSMPVGVAQFTPPDVPFGFTYSSPPSVWTQNLDDAGWVIVVTGKTTTACSLSVRTSSGNTLGAPHPSVNIDVFVAPL